MAPELLAADGGDLGDWQDDVVGAAGGMVGAGAGAAGLPDDLVHFVPGEENPLMLFFRSLLPWNVVVPQGGAPPGRHDDAGHRDENLQ